MVKMLKKLDLYNCPHCHVVTPNLILSAQFESEDFQKKYHRWWKTYTCNRCGGVILAGNPYGPNEDYEELYPHDEILDENIPEKAKYFLGEAINTLHSPPASVVMSASSVDAMLKEKEYNEGSLYSRIEQAVNDGLITEPMAKWAHKVRLESNKPRHADKEDPIPTAEQANKCIEFVKAFAHYLFVLPAWIEEGLKEEKNNEENTDKNPPLPNARKGGR